MYDKLEKLHTKIAETESLCKRLKAIKFLSMQTFDSVQKTFDNGEVYTVEGVGYAIITKKEPTEVNFVTIVRNGAIWQPHTQDIDKHIEIKQGVYLDLLTMQEYTDSLVVPAYETAYFQSVGCNDLVIKGKVFKN